MFVIALWMATRLLPGEELSGYAARLRAAAAELRREAALLEAELFAEKERQVDALFGLAQTRGRVDARGLTAALKTRLVDENLDAHDKKKAERLLTEQNVAEAMAELGRGPLLRRADMESPTALRLRLERIARDRRRVVVVEPPPQVPMPERFSALLCYALPALHVAPLPPLAHILGIAFLLHRMQALSTPVRLAAGRALVLDVLAFVALPFCAKWLAYLFEVSVATVALATALGTPASLASTVRTWWTNSTLLLDNSTFFLRWRSSNTTTHDPPPRIT